MLKFFSDKNDLFFLTIGIVIFIIIVATLSYSINFVIQKINQALNSDLIKSEEIVSFNLDELENIKPILDEKLK